MKRFFSFILFISCSLTVLAQVDTAQQVIPGRSNSPEQQEKPYVILISADGFRYDYAEKYKAEHLLALADAGVKASSMVPSFPSVTFPNHYTIVTGLYPSHHGLIDNSFYDRTLKRAYSYKGKTASEGIWYGGTPLWVLAEQQKMVTASYFWVGSEAAIQNTYPAYYYKFNQVTPIDKRIAAVVYWLKLPPEKRPHLITFYFPQVDHEGHKHGPNSPEVENAVHFVDSAVYELTKAVSKTGLKVNYIFVSDHGMTTPDIVNTLKLPAAIDTSKYIVGDHGLMIDLYAKNPDDIQKTYEQLKKEARDYQVFLRVNIPKHYHYSKSDDRYGRIGDIILISNYPKVFNIHNSKSDPGWHGFDPEAVKDMHATFYAWGPAFKTNTQISSFPNVDIYPLVAEILGLKYTFKVDGTRHLAKEVLK
ncbi:ectonucleotide pyrophosphatase/phosphodiesterase [Mucilaginibacter sp. BT774]|uniref:alkaline phosphatase family protein n=1 Tax=Mucilaginibacter sp. BT774 TaxID=3062276 RepID=UPI00267567B7|nr:ectonucleotide pyrophosphatase/phosphodiesterase [Mucilaginibacter sp. BT774]MDO3627883.1 ectonucleotide pyrophosphatase/phosphodiesterase [Mucilaginibacter sp. BT774]